MPEMQIYKTIRLTWRKRWKFRKEIFK